MAAGTLGHTICPWEDLSTDEPHALGNDWLQPAPWGVDPCPTLIIRFEGNVGGEDVNNPLTGIETDELIGDYIGRRTPESGQTLQMATADRIAIVASRSNIGSNEVLPRSERRTRTYLSEREVQHRNLWVGACTCLVVAALSGSNVEIARQIRHGVPAITPRPGRFSLVWAIQYRNRYPFQWDSHLVYYLSGKREC